MWPSNEDLISRLGCKLRTLQHNLSLLTKANLIHFIDCSSRKRWGRRDENGRIQIAFGIDLRPMAFRLQELLQSAETERSTVKETKRYRKEVRFKGARILEMLINAAKHTEDLEPWKGFHDRYKVAIEQIEEKLVQIPTLKAVDELLSPLEVEVQIEIRRLLRVKTANDFNKEKIITPEGAKNHTHKTTTNSITPNGESVSAFGKSSGANHRTELVTSTVDEIAGDADIIQIGPHQIDEHINKYKLTPELVMKACPDFVAIAETLSHGTKMTPSWNNIILAAKANMSILGIADHAWAAVSKQLGDRGAAIALALTAERAKQGFRGSQKSLEQVGGYFYWFKKIAKREGKCVLGPKIYALLPKIAKNAEGQSNEK